MVMSKVRLVLLILLLLYSSVNAFESKDYVTFFGRTDQHVTISWNQVSSATMYEVRAYHNEQEIYFWVGSTTNPEIIYQLPKSGHYTFMVRAVGDTWETTWCTSIDPVCATVDGNPRAWWAYGYVAPPGPIVIE